MICHQVESTAKAYLVAVTGALARSAGDPLVDDDGWSLVASPEGMPGYAASGRSVAMETTGVPVDAGLVFYFYLGENNTDIKHPCAIVSASSGEADIETGNETVELTVAVKVPAVPYRDAAGLETTPLVTALEISEAIYNALFRSDACDYLNLYRTDAERLTVIGYTARGHVKAPEGEHLLHQINLTLYCAARDLSPTLPLQS